jgi:hypothetical protein
LAVKKSPAAELSGGAVNVGSLDGDYGLAGAGVVSAGGGVASAGGVAGSVVPTASLAVSMAPETASLAFS